MDKLMKPRGSEHYKRKETTVQVEASRPALSRKARPIMEVQ
jgi:hypothetical protein